MKVGRIQRARNAFSRWFQWDYHVLLLAFIRDRANRYFIVRRQQAEDTFQAAALQYGLSEEDLLQQAAGLWRLAMINLLLFFVMVAYGFYLLFSNSFPGAAVALSLSGVIMAFVIRYHFWYYQIKQRRLGCGLLEWINKGILGRH